MTAFEDLPEKEKERLKQDEDTLRAMGSIYCRKHHDEPRNEDGLCEDCRSCVEYAIARTRVCPNLHKGNCEDCDIRCYSPQMRAQIREIMSFAGPRMPFRHPVMTVRYLRKKLGKRR